MTEASTAKQSQLPLALVRGNRVTDQPHDLFIPPDALEVFLESFEGPLDFLLYLIRKQKFDILDLPIADITMQYMQYVDVMKDLNLELAGEYLVMAAILAEIKSRILLPVNKDKLEDESDPRAELVKQLLAYEKYKSGAEILDSLPQRGRDTHRVHAKLSERIIKEERLPEVSLQDLTSAIVDALNRASNFTHHQVKRETLSTRDRMKLILEKVKATPDFMPFGDFFTHKEGREGVVVTFLAILELVKESAIIFTQSRPFAPIYVKAKLESTFDESRIS